jgi:hypothetical protein
MFKVIKNGSVLCMEDYARYVRLQTNGVYVLCSENEADGVIANDEIHALDSVQLVEFIGTVELTDVRTELEQTIADARQNLISPPTRDAPWSADVRYAAGDTVEGGYVALRYNRNKNPADYLGVYWVHDENEVVAWESIEDGTIIYAGGIVSYGGKTWRCVEQHIKSSVHKPKTGSSKWEEVAS